MQWSYAVELPCGAILGGTDHATRRLLKSACIPSEHLTETSVAPPSAGPHVGGLATSPEGEHYCGGGGRRPVPWCLLTGEVNLTPAHAGLPGDVGRHQKQQSDGGPGAGSHGGGKE